MKKIIYLFLITLLTITTGYSQSLSQTVVANSGTTLIGASNTLSFTMGEAVVGNISNSESLGQGFWLGAIEAVVLSNEDFTLEIQATVYPNPVSDYLHLAFQEMAGEDFEIALYDINGKQVLHKELLNCSANETISLSTFNTGTYLLKIVKSSTNKSKTIKIIKN